MAIVQRTLDSLVLAGLSVVFDIAVMLLKQMHRSPSPVVSNPTLTEAETPY